MKKKKESLPLLRFVLLKQSSAKKKVWTFGFQILLKRKAAVYKRKPNIKEKNLYSKAADSKFTALPMLNKMSIKEKINRGRRVYRHVENNPDFSMMFPAPSQLRRVVEALEDAECIASNNGRAMEREILSAKEDEFDDVFRAILSFIDWVAKGSEEVYRRAGITWKK